MCINSITDLISIYDGLIEHGYKILDGSYSPMCVFLDKGVVGIDKNPNSLNGLPKKTDKLFVIPTSFWEGGYTWKTYQKYLAKLGKSLEERGIYARCFRPLDIKQQTTFENI